MTLRVTAFPFCRADDLSEPFEEYPDALERSLADETYVFAWNSEFGGSATIKIARQARRVAVARLYRPSQFEKARRCRGSLSCADWERLEDALVEAGFWLLDEDAPRGLFGKILGTLDSFPISH
jgi:hypothetical protein